MAPSERRRQLLDAALELIAADGYGAVTIEAIANRVGVTRPVVYSVFANVDELLLALLDRAGEPDDARGAPGGRRRGRRNPAS